MHFSLCDTILDLVQNSYEAKAGQIDLTIVEDDHWLKMDLRDNGCGMTNEEMQKARDPFYSDGEKHRHRKVGLGLPFLEQSMDMTEGRFQLESRKGEGTRLQADFNLDHLDTPPLGDLPSMFMQAFCFDGAYNMTIRREINTKDRKESYELDRQELQEVLGDFSRTDNMILLRDFIRSQEEI